MYIHLFRNFTLPNFQKGVTILMIKTESNLFLIQWITFQQSDITVKK